MLSVSSRSQPSRAGLRLAMISRWPRSRAFDSRWQLSTLQVPNLTPALPWADHLSSWYWELDQVDLNILRKCLKIMIKYFYRQSETPDCYKVTQVYLYLLVA